MGQISKIDEFGLDIQQRRFVENYLICLDKKEAAEKAGYDPSMGTALINHPLIEIAISELSQNILKRMQMGQEEAIGNIARIARTTVKDVFEQDKDGEFKVKKQIQPEAMDAIQEIKVDKDGNQSIKMYNRMDALKTVLQLTGGLIQRHEHKVEVSHNASSVEALIEKCERLINLRRIEGEVIDVIPETTTIGADT